MTSTPRRVSRVFVRALCLIASAVVALPVSGAAQARGAASTVPTTRIAPPGVKFETVGRAKSSWPVVDASLPHAGYLTVVALTPGVNRFAVQVLWPKSPSDSGWLEPGQFRRLATFQDSAVSHRVTTGGTSARPFVIGFFSPDRPTLEAFARAGLWATDVVIRAPIDSSTDLVDLAAAVIFPQDGARFAANLYRETEPVNFIGRSETAANGGDIRRGEKPTTGGDLKPGERYRRECNVLDLGDPCGAAAARRGDPLAETRRKLQEARRDTVSMPRKPPRDTP